MAQCSDAGAVQAFRQADALLIDIDGTLIDSTAPVLRAWDAFAKRHGLETEAALRFAQGRPSRESVRLLAPDADHATEAALLEEAEISDTEGVSALPGALEILTSGRTLAIVTSCSLQLARARLAAAGLPEPAVMVTSDDVEHGKPDPECYRLGAECLGVPSPACVVLEDAPAGIAAGIGAGAKVIALASTHSAAELTDADWIIDGLPVLLQG